MAQSFWQAAPRRIDLPVVWLLSLGTLIAGLSLPFMTVQKLVFWESEYTLFTSIKGLWGNGHYFLAVVIFFFSIIFPFAKLGVLGWVWVRPMDRKSRKKLMHWVGILGKWSMLDVFVIALLIVLTTAKGFVDASPTYGLYFFSASVLLSIVLSHLMDGVGRSASSGSDASE